jgi:hypothetical protein
MEQAHMSIVIREPFKPNEGNLITIELIESPYQAFIDEQIRVDGDDHFIRMIVDSRKKRSPDVTVDEEIFIRIAFSELIKLRPFSFCAIKIIVSSHPDDTADGFIHKASLSFDVIFEFVVFSFAHFNSVLPTKGFDFIKE